jgi:ketosteroid isomerase-like protein
MAGKTDLLRERYQQFSQGDVEGALSNWTDDFTWEGGNSEDMPGGGTHEGKDKAVQVLQQAVGAWDEFKLVADEFFENGDTVVVLGHTEVRKGDQTAKLPSCISGVSAATTRSADCRSSPTRCRAPAYSVEPEPAGFASVQGRSQQAGASRAPDD